MSSELTRPLETSDLFILPRTWALLRETVSVLLEDTPSDIHLAALREVIGNIPGVAGVHD